MLIIRKKGRQSGLMKLSIRHGFSQEKEIIINVIQTDQSVNRLYICVEIYRNQPLICGFTHDWEMLLTTEEDLMSCYYRLP